MQEQDAALRETDSDTGSDGDAPEMVEIVMDHEENYVDEEKYTKVLVEDVTVSKQGLEKVTQKETEEVVSTPKPVASVKKRAVKKRKPKFRYESKAERKITRQKQHSGNRTQAKLRRE